MLIVAFASNDRKLSEGDYNFYLDQVPFLHQSRITKYRRWQDAQASLFGRLLLKELLLLMHGTQYNLNDVQVNKWGRPYIDGRFDFNITHAGSYVACAYFSSGKVGIDLELIQEVEIAPFENIFTQRELIEINLSLNRTASFYDYWTIKEAVSKADGRGLNLPLKTIEIANGNAFVGLDQWFYQKLPFKNNYVLHIATDTIAQQCIQLIHVKFKKKN